MKLINKDNNTKIEDGKKKSDNKNTSKTVVTPINKPSSF